MKKREPGAAEGEKPRELQRKHEGVAKRKEKNKLDHPFPI